MFFGVDMVVPLLSISSLKTLQYPEVSISKFLLSSGIELRLLSSKFLVCALAEINDKQKMTEKMYLRVFILLQLTSVYTLHSAYIPYICSPLFLR